MGNPTLRSGRVVHLLGIGALRFIEPMEAALIHMGPDILVFLNSVKLLWVKIHLTGAAPSSLVGRRP